MGIGRLTRVASLVLFGLASAGCGEDPPACSSDKRPSVVVDVVDGQGLPAEDAKVVFSVDGGPEQPATSGCTDKEACDRWTAGVEQTGRFQVRATRAASPGQAQKLVEITKDECHVITQAVQLEVP
jgi:hypothetical protein